MSKFVSVEPTLDVEIRTWEFPGERFDLNQIHADVDAGRFVKPELKYRIITLFDDMSAEDPSVLGTQLELQLTYGTNRQVIKTVFEGDYVDNEHRVDAKIIETQDILEAIANYSSLM